MMGSLLSILLMGMIPVWGTQDSAMLLSSQMHVAPPALTALHVFDALDQSLTASGVIIVDLDSGQTVFDRNKEIARPMASLTKLMTALIIVEEHDLGEWVTIPPEVHNVAGTVAGLPSGERFTVGSLLSALLIESANDAAYTLALYHSGSLEEFVDEMNQRAQELGLRATSYENPSGLDATKQQSSPRDLAWLTMYVMRNAAIADRMGTAYTDIFSQSGKMLRLAHTHQLLHADDVEDLSIEEQAVIAGKTGTTDAAGQCLLSIVEAKGHRYIAILLHSRDRYADMKKVVATLTQ